MGNLPAPRVISLAPFTHTGVDYAEPMHIIPSVGRGQRSKKLYVMVFICLSTKAVDLEYVDDDATDGFLAAFKRFASHRVSRLIYIAITALIFKVRSENYLSPFSD